MSDYYAARQLWIKRKRNDDEMTEQTIYKNKVGKIVEQDKSSITIEGTDGKRHTFAKESGGKIHGMLEGTGNGDAGEYNNSKTGFLIFWKTTKKATPSPVKSISNEPAPKAETDKKAASYGFVVSPGVVDVGGDAIEQAQARIDAKNTAPEKSIEDMIRETMKTTVPSERVGYRISLAGAVNSVIEIHKLNGTKATIDDIKKEAVELFLWMDFLTTQNINRG